ncbi:MAG: hypothetical protein ACOC44_13720 [Promethearchaeia archaeon]
MGLNFGSFNFEIFITGEDPRLNTRLRAIPRYKPIKKVKKTKDGREVRNTSRAIFTYDNRFMKKMRKDKNLRKEFMNADKEINLKWTGKEISRTFRILFNQDDDLCYNFTEYEIEKDRHGRIIPCKKCGEVYCKHQIKTRTRSNINREEKPIVFIKPMRMKKLEAIKKWSFGRSYQLRHVDGLTFKFCYELAEKLHNTGDMVLMAPINMEEKKPEKLILRNNTRGFYAWLEGRIKGKKYALILHRATLKLID